MPRQSISCSIWIRSRMSQPRCRSRGPGSGKNSIWSLPRSVIGLSTAGHDTTNPFWSTTPCSPNSRVWDPRAAAPANNLAPINALRARFPELPQVACFDTAFHRGHSAVADRYAIPERFYAEGVRRYGFHGLSYEYVAGRLREIAPMSPRDA